MGRLSIDNAPLEKCGTCGKKEAGRMVACDDCNLWFHFTCVNAPENIEELPWSCTKCRMRKDTSTQSSSTTGTPTNAGGPRSPATVQTQLEQLLKSQVALQKTVKELQTNLQTTKNDLNKQKLETQATNNKLRATEQELELLKNQQQNVVTPAQNLHNQNADNANLNNEEGNRRNSHVEDDVESIHSSVPSSANALALAELTATMKRKYLSKLPTFTGEIKEWAKFEAIYKRTTVEGMYSEVDNVTRLREALRPPASDQVEHLLIYSSDATAIMKELRETYGRPDKLILCLLNELYAFPNLKFMSDPKLRKLASRVNSYVSTVKSMSLTAELTNSFAVNTLAAKLHDIHYREWCMYKNLENASNLEKFAEFLTLKVRELPPERFDRSQPKPSSTESKPKRVMTHHHSSSSSSRQAAATIQPGSCAFCNRKGHSLGECFTFDKKSARDRNKFVSEKNLCFVCLKTNEHKGYVCPEKKQCTVENCLKIHHPKLHTVTYQPPVTQTVQPSSSQQNNNTSAPAPDSVMNHRSKSATLFKILPIKVFRADGNFIETSAFLDDGSSLTLMEKQLFDKLGVESTREDLHLRWTNGIERREDSARADIFVSSAKNNKKFCLTNVFSIDNLDLPEQSIDAEVLKQNYSHLRSLPLVDMKGAKPQILIGLQHAKFLVGDKHHSGEENDPVASKTRLGWVVYGNACPSLNFVSTINATVSGVQLSIREASQQGENLNELVKGYFTTENFGVTPSATDLVSRETKRANEIMKRTLKMTNNRYEIGLLWKSDNVKLPNSYPMAMKRLVSLERSLQKDPAILEWKNNHVKELLNKGYARIATPEELKKTWERVWYCPTFVTINKNKVPPKPRDVADVAAKVENQSLNSHLLKGPDNLAPLIGGLFKFREEAIAVNADVKEMFHQIKIIEPDQQCQRFLWRDADQSKDPTVYVMERMMFGPTCSPTCAQFVKNTHAATFAHKYPDAVDGLVKRTYVDDYFNSHATVEDAIEVCRNALEICDSMGFDLTGFQSNNAELLKSLPPSKIKTKLVSLCKNNQETSITKVLGMYWDSISDTFTYKIFRDELMEKMETSDYQPTKREVLRTLMRIFDPLGLISHYLIRGKIILQEIWREGTDWDEPITESLNEMWKSFISHLQNIEDIKIPRKYTTLEPSKCRVQLITFVDASERAFAATSYFRFTQDDEVTIAHVMSKAKVAPTKRLTIPQLELQAAVLGVRLADTIKSLHSIEIHEQIFLSDSRVTLLWIHSEKYNFKTFVAARVGEILDKSTKKEWLHVGTKENVADDATKWTDPTMGDNDSRWFKGCSFLKLPQTEWPVTAINPNEETEETYNTVLMIDSRPKNALTQTSFIDSIGDRFKTRWTSLIRVVAFMLRLVNIRKKISHTSFISSEEFLKAEEIVFKKIQHDAFMPEVKALEAGNCVPNSSKLKKFSPFIKDGLIRMSTRVQFTVDISYAARCPIILPNKHPLVDTFIKHIHERNLHRGEEMTVADVKQRAWVIDTRTAVRRVKNRCQHCKIRDAKPQHPLMGQLPTPRIDFGVKPFTHVGLDVFGPYKIKMGRSSVKRYGLIFTCLTYRAVHLEILDDMTTSHCLMSIRNFLVRRGMSQHFYSDNGKNFVGANNILMTEFNKLSSQLSEKVSNEFFISWHFISAYSPWCGGAWERLIKSIKQCLNHLLHEEVPEESVFRNAMIQAEFWMNRRPLTHVPIDHEDSEPLTPNTVLFGDNQDRLATIMNTFDKSDGISKRAAQRAQHLVEKFLHKWNRQYLPNLLKREKWQEVTEPVKVGDIAILTEPNQPRDAWSRCRIIAVHPGADGVIRSVDVKLHDNTIKRNRSVARIAVLSLKSSSTEDSDGPGHVADANQNDLNALQTN